MRKRYKATVVLGLIGIGVFGFYEPTDTVEAAINYSILQRSTYPKVNTYIKQQNLWIPKITKQFTQFPKFDYRNGNGQAEGIVIHETANKNSTIHGEIAYMRQNYENAFVHAFVDKDNIIQIHPADYAVWGAGKQANPRFYQIELVEHNTFHQFAQSVNNDAFLIANMLHYFDLAPSRATKEGSGTVWTHDEVSRYLGGTNHTDPVGYFAQWGYTVNEFYSLIVEKYNAMPNQVYQEQDMVGAYALPVDPHNYGVWSSAINGKKVANLSNYANQHIYVQKRVRTNTGDWYLIGKEGKDVGWVNASSLQLTSISSTPDQDAYNYGVWSNYVGGKRVAGLSSYSGKSIEVTNEKYVNGSSWVQFSVNGNVIGWVAKDGVAIGSKPEEVPVVVDLTGMPVANAYDYGIWTDYNGGSFVKGLNMYSNQTTKVLKTVKDSKGVEKVQISVDGKVIGWVAKKAIDMNVRPVNYKGMPTTDSYNYGVWNYYTGNNKRISSLSFFANKVLTVTNEAILPDGTKWLQFSADGKVIGWVGEKGINQSVIPVNYAAMPATDAYNYGIWSNYTGNNKRLGSLNNYANKQLTITKEATLPDGTKWVEFSVDKKVIGWVNIKAINTNVVPVNYAAMPVTDAYNYGIWSNYTGNNNRLGSLNAYANKQLTITKEATLPDGTKWLQFSADGKVIGWVGEKGIDQNVVPVNYAAMPVADAYNYGIWINYTGNNKRLGSLDAYVNKQLTITKEAALPDGTKWVEFSADGKIIGWVNIKAINTNVVPVNYAAMPAADAYNYGIWSNYAGSSKRLGSLNNYTNKQLTITKEATLPDGTKWVEFSADGKIIGWIGQNAINVNKVNLTSASIQEKKEPIEVATLENINGTFIVTSENYDIWSSYQRESNNIGNLSEYSGDMITVTQKATFNDGAEWFEVSLEGNTIGWISETGIEINELREEPRSDSESMSELEGSSVTTAVVAKDSAHVVIKDGYTIDSKVVGELADYSNLELVVTQKVTTENQNDWFEIAFNNEVIGWIKSDSVELK